MNKKIMLLLVVAVLVAGLTCWVVNKGGDTAKGSRQEQAQDRTAAKAIDPNRQMIVAIPGLPDTMDCMNTSSLYVRLGANYQTYDTLLAKDGKGAIVLNMAESYEMAPDAAECTFKLKEGIKFWDGTPVTANDVRFTLERAKRSSGSQTAACNDIASVEVIDDHNFKIVMKNPNVALFEYLTYFFILSESFTTRCGDKYGTSPETTMGCGPYKVTEWVFGDHIVYEAFADYFKGAPAIKSVLVKVISDTNAAVIALQTGEIDLYMNDLPFISLATLKSDSKLKLESFYSNRFNYVVLNVESGMFKDLKMREAVAYALNRKEMLLIACEEEENGILVNSPAGPDFGGNPGHEYWPYEQDVEKARALVKEAGNTGKKTVIKTLNVEPYMKLATKLQDYLMQIGIVAEVAPMENSAYIADVCANGNYEIAICFNGYGGKEIDIALGNLHSGKYGLAGNYPRIVDDKLDAYIMKGKITLDREERREVYREAVRYYAEQLPQIPLYYINATRAFNADLDIDEGYAEYDRYYNYRWAK